MKRAIILATMSVLCFLQVGWGQVPRTFSYQGVLKDASGVLVDNTLTITFSLYDVETSETAIWSELHSATTVTDGVFSVTLGSSDPLDLDFDVQYWLEIAVNGAPLSPRTRLTASPYCFYALNADTASHLSTDANLFINSIFVGRMGAQWDGSDGAAGEFMITNASNNADAVVAQTLGVGSAGDFRVTHTSSAATALYVRHSGTGSVAHFYQDNETGYADAVKIDIDSYGDGLLVDQGGYGRAAYFIQNNPNSDEDAVKIANDGTGYGLYVSGPPGGIAGYFEGNVEATGSITHGSDRRWKKDITTIDNALDKALNLEGVFYKWNRSDYPEKSFEETRQIGFIAQDVEKVLPEVVRSNKDGYKSIDYSKVSVLLLEALRSQQEQINELQEALENLQSSLSKAHLIKYGASGGSRSTGSPTASTTSTLLTRRWVR